MRTTRGSANDEFGQLFAARPLRWLITTRSWSRDLAVVIPFIALGVCGELLFSTVTTAGSALGHPSPLTRRGSVAAGATWEPVLLAGVAVLACRRLATHLRRDPTPRRLRASAATAGLVFLLAALTLTRLTGTPAARYLPLAAAFVAVLRTSKWAARRRLRAPTIAGFRPSRRALLHLRGIRALQLCAYGVPSSGLYSTNQVDAAYEGGVSVFGRRGDARSEAYVRARLVEYDLIRGQLVRAEGRLAAAPALVRDEPALLCAEAAFLRAVGQHAAALRLLERVQGTLKRTAPAAFTAVLTQSRALVDGRAGDNGNLRRTWLVLAGHASAVTLEFAATSLALVQRDEEVALRAAHRTCALVDLVQAHPLVDLRFAEIERLSESRAIARMAIAEICHRRGCLYDAADAYLDAADDFLRVKDRARFSECMLRGAGAALVAGYATPDREAHVLDLMRVAFEAVESERGGLRTDGGRAEWVRNQRDLYLTAFGHLVEQITWQRNKAAELALWLLESLHRTVLGAAIASELTVRDSELLALLAELAALEQGNGLDDGDESPTRRMPQAAIATARDAVIERFTHARDAALVVNRVDVGSLRLRLGNAVAVVYQCVRDARGWVVHGVLMSLSHGESAFVHLLPAVAGASAMDSACAMLDAIEARDCAAITAAFSTPLWDEVWAEFAAVLPPPLAQALADATVAHHADLIIVPDGPLAGVPFSGLTLGDGRLVAEVATVRLVPSLSMLAEQAVGAPSKQARTIVTHIDDDVIPAREAGRRASNSVATRATHSSADLEAAFRQWPRPDLAVILAHGRMGLAVGDNEVLLKDGRISATRAMGLSWPKAVILGSCWLGSSNIEAGAEPFGFPIACLLGGASTIAGALSPTPPVALLGVLDGIAHSLPTAETLAAAVTAVVVPPPDRRVAWREAAPIEWACLTVWSTVAPARGHASPAPRPAFWSDDGVPSGDVAAEATGALTLAMPISAALCRVLIVASQSAVHGSLDSASVLVEAARRDPTCRDLPSAASVGAIKAAAGVAPEDPGGPLALSHATRIPVSQPLAAALKRAQRASGAWRLAEVTTEVLVAALLFEEGVYHFLRSTPGGDEFALAVVDLLACAYTEAGAEFLDPVRTGCYDREMCAESGASQAAFSGGREAEIAGAIGGPWLRMFTVVSKRESS